MSGNLVPSMPALHEKTIVISEAHLDSFGHMNNARYLELFEQARWDLITERGFGIDMMRKVQMGPTILGVEMKFLKELVPRETVVIRTELATYERKIGKIRQAMVKANGEVACEAVFTFGLFDITQRKLVEPTPEWAYAVGFVPKSPSQIEK
jgi:acyl-CoA thioester hydrolase